MSCRSDRGIEAQLLIHAENSKIFVGIASCILMMKNKDARSPITCAGLAVCWDMFGAGGEVGRVYGQRGCMNGMTYNG